MTEQAMQTRQFHETLKYLRTKNRSLLRKLDTVRTHAETGKTVKVRSIGDMITELTEIDGLQKKIRDEYRAIFNEDMQKDEKLTFYDKRVCELNSSILKQETGFIVSRFREIRSDDKNCQKLVDQFARKLEKIDSKKMSLDDYRNAVADYIRFYALVESGDTESKLEFSTEDTVFTEDSALLLKFIQGKYYIRQTEKI